jgi:hypothetical protein
MAFNSVVSEASLSRSAHSWCPVACGARESGGDLDIARAVRGAGADDHVPSSRVPCHQLGRESAGTAAPSREPDRLPTRVRPARPWPGDGVGSPPRPVGYRSRTWDPAEPTPSTPMPRRLPQDGSISQRSWFPFPYSLFVRRVPHGLWNGSASTTARRPALSDQKARNQRRHTHVAQQESPTTVVTSPRRLVNPLIRSDLRAGGADCW